MPVVAILGAGTLGGALAMALTLRDRVSCVRLIDEASAVAAGTSLDIRQAGPVTGFATTIECASDSTATEGADVLVIALPASDEARTIDAQVQLVRDVARRDIRTPIVLAAPDGSDVIERVAAETDVARSRLVGTAPAALGAALRTLIAGEAGVSSADVSLNVLGRPPDRTVVAWEAATVAGDPLADVLTPPCIARLAGRIPQLWPPGPIVLAMAAARIVETLALDGRRRWCCSVVVDGENGPRAVALPVDLGPEGVERVLEPVVSPRERVLLDSLRHGR